MNSSNTIKGCFSCGVQSQVNAYRIGVSSPCNKISPLNRKEDKKNKNITPIQGSQDRLVSALGMKEASF